MGILGKRRDKLDVIYLHIGCEKTGTTSIQRAFGRNRRRLLSAGTLYPKSLGETNHLALSAYCLNEDKQTPLRRSWGLNSSHDLQAFRQELKEKFKEEIEKSGAKQAILSSEQLSSNVTDIQEVLRLKEWLNDCAHEVRVVVYLRRQDQMFLSSYSTEIKAGGTHLLDPYSIKKNSIKYNFKKMLELWDLKGLEVTVRYFDRDLLKDNDILSDFKSTVGLKDVEFLGSVVRDNPSLTDKTVEFLRLSNAYLPPIGENGWLRGNLQDLLSSLELGEKLTLSEDESAYILSLFKEENESVYEAYLKDQCMSNPFGFEGDTLDTGKLEKIERENKLTLEDAAYIFSELWMKKQRQLVDERNKKA